jgi:hypothetical protein
LIPEFRDLAIATAEGISHPNFRFRTFVDAAGRHRLAIDSDTKHHTLEPAYLEGRETVGEILAIAKGLAEKALAEDLTYRFHFVGLPVYARPAY